MSYVHPEWPEWMREVLEVLSERNPEAYEFYRSLAERTEQPLINILIEAMEAARPILEQKD